jgi:hypothetical protein
MTDNGKHCSLQLYLYNYDRKTFYDWGLTKDFLHQNFFSQNNDRPSISINRECFTTTEWNKFNFFDKVINII